MFPGQVTRLTEISLGFSTTIDARADLLIVANTTATTTCATINQVFDAQSGVIIIVNRSGASIATLTTGNILTAVTLGVNVAIAMVWSKSLLKWVPGALA